MLLLGDAGLYGLMRLALTAQFDAGLSGKARSLASAVHIDAATGHVEIEFAVETMPEFERTRDSEYFQLWFLPDDGTPSAGPRSISLGSGSLPVMPRSTVQAADIPLPDGRDGRCVWLAFSAGLDQDDGPAAGSVAHPLPSAAEPQRMMLAFAASRSELDRSIRTLLSALLGSGLLVYLSAAAAMRCALVKGLRPIDELAAGVAALRPADLPDRIAVGPLPAELEPVRQRLDELLVRVRSAFERERRFTAAAAHELRTPLAELHSLLDVRLKWPEDIGSCVESMTAARGVTRRMERLVGVLLTLARAEHGRTELSQGTVDLAGEVRAAVERWSRPMQAKELQVQVDVPAALPALGDASTVAAIIENLLANAAEYTPRNGWVRIGCEKRSDAAEVAVANGPIGMAPDDVGRLFEPFWRGDAARGQDGNHLGLGLALVDALARGMRAMVIAEPVNGGLRVVLRLRP